MITVSLILLGLAVALFLYRLALGPSLTDRALSLDGLVATGISILIVLAATNDQGTFLPVVVVLASVGFIGTSVIARFIEDQDG